MSRLWLELLEDDLASGNDERIFSAIRKIAEDDTGDVTFIEQRLAETLLSKVPRWINVKERLPEDDRDVLILSENVNMSVGWWDGHWRSNLYANIKYWMPLPAPPSIKGKIK